MKKNQEKTSPNTTNRGYKPYKSYNESGVEWFKKIPTHWEPVKLAYFLKKNQSGTWGDAAEEDGEIILRSTEQTVDGNWDIEDPARRDITEQEYQETKLIAGDLLLTISSGSKDHIGKTSLVTQEIEERGCSFSNFMQRLRPKDSLSSPFLNYLLNSPISREQFKYFQSSTTGLGNLNSSLIDQLRIPKPPSKEQKAIVKFLGHETSKIDRLIEKKEKLIGLLEEKRNSLITKVTTRGISDGPNVKSSRFQWFENIPEHWKTRKLKQVAEIIPSNVNKKTREEEKEVKLCNYSEVYNYSKINSSLDFMKASASDKQMKKLSLEKGDVILTKDSERWDDIAVPAYVAEDIEDLVCGYHLSVLRPKSNNISGKYLYFVLSAEGVADQFHVKSNGVTRFGLSIPDLKDGVIPFPPKQEQKKIVNFIESQSEVIDHSIESIKKSTEKLQEYRTALISAAVTGKIDIRGEVE